MPAQRRAVAPEPSRIRGHVPACEARERRDVLDRADAADAGQRPHDGACQARRSAPDAGVNAGDDWLPVLLFTAGVVLLLSQCDAFAEDAPQSADPPVTARDLVLNEPRAYALATQPDAVLCYQVRKQGRTRVCITETEWRRQHAEDVTQVEVPHD